MDVAYDHTFEEPVVNQKSEKGKEPEAPQESLSDEFQQAYKAISASPWGARFGTFLGTVKERVPSPSQDRMRIARDAETVLG